MRNGYVKLAGALAIIYAITFFGGIFVNYLISGSTYTLKYSLGLPKTWIVLVAALVIGFGLLKHYRWSWWLGLLAGTYQLIGISLAAQRLLSSESTLPVLMSIFIVLFIAFLTLLLLPSVRRQFLTNGSISP